MELTHGNRLRLAKILSPIFLIMDSFPTFAVLFFKKRYVRNCKHCRKTVQSG
jgi:hypothetical protein